ncbi:MAG: preprotein translocase subunit YajC [Clostridia bacterium]|nr:preprotein translocase subunit YajC [Clostridia bacterium]
MFYFLEGEPQNTGGSAIITIVMLVAMIAIFYFLMWRPQKKQEKQTKAMLDSLAVGDEVTTIGGIIGKVVSIKEETVLIETGRDKTRIRFLRTAIRNIDVKAEDAE